MYTGHSGAPVAKVLVNQSEYTALKNMKKQYEQVKKNAAPKVTEGAEGTEMTAPPAGGAQSAPFRMSTSTQAAEQDMESVRLRAQERQDEQRQQDLNPGGNSDPESSDSEEDGPGMSACLDSLAPYLSTSRERDRAAVLIKKLCAHPKVHFDGGCLVIGGQRIGHLALVVYALLKNPSETLIKEENLVRKLLKLSPKNSSRKSKGKVKDKPSKKKSPSSLSNQGNIKTSVYQYLS